MQIRTPQLFRLSSRSMDTTERTTKIRNLDDLAALGPEELMALYIAARTPSLEELDGRLVGRMLAVPRAHRSFRGRERPSSTRPPTTATA